MAEITVDTPPVSRRKIIERPRLTRLLDESPARVKMLVAPAGYGKTTLARQWLNATSGRTGRWITCSTASSDVAVLTNQISEVSRRAASVITGSSVSRFRDPAKGFRALVASLVDDLSEWDEAAWIVLDDYHEITSSVLAEDLIGEVIERTNVNVFVTSRRRPAWVTARNLVYADALEIGQGLLAMTAREIDEIMAERSDVVRDGQLDVSNGWPAFVALAAGAPTLTAVSAHGQSDVYSFLVREIFQSADELTRHALCEVALAPRDHAILLRRLYSALEASQITADGLRSGILTTNFSGDIELHPLMRSMLVNECLKAGPDVVGEAVEKLWDILLRDWRFDDLFELVVTSERPTLVSVLLREALDPLMAAGRTASVRRWIDYASEHRTRDPFVAIAEATLAIRDGTLGRARVHALEATEHADPSTEDGALAWSLAGQASHLQGDDESAIAYFQTACSLAKTEPLRRTARWGRFVSSLDAESEDVESALAEIVGEPATEPVGLIDRWSAQLLYEIRVSGIHSLSGAREATEVIHLVDDPVRRTGFRSIYTCTLGLAAEYEKAQIAATAFLEDVRASQVEFALPYALTGGSVALLGLREFVAARHMIERAAAESERLGDRYALSNAHALAARLDLSTGLHAEAYGQLMFDSGAGLTRGMVGEVLGCRALALACLGRAAWEDAAAEAIGASRNLETNVLTASAAAVFASVRNSSELRLLASRAVDIAVSSGIWDLFICAYRAHPEFLTALKDDAHRLRHVLRIMSQAGDLGMADRLGIQNAGISTSTLSPREREIHSLLALGLTNKAIAQRLFISEATAKLHVHHILEKLKVRSRTAAALRYVERASED